MTTISRRELIEPLPGRSIEYVDGEWVITEHGKIIARDLEMTEEDAEWLIAEFKKQHSA